jgi:hypothetical protein
MWRRHEGELLRPAAFSEADIDQLKEIINPDFEALYQQFLGELTSIRILGSDFGTFTFRPPDGRVRMGGVRAASVATLRNE